MIAEKERETYLRRATKLVPEFVKSRKLIDSGWSNIVVEINNDWVCRFVRDTVSAQFHVETEFLKSFVPFSPIAVPDLVSIGDDYMVYRRLHGERFSPQKYQSFNQAEKKAVHRHIGEFLYELHSMRFEHSQLKAFPYGGEDFWGDLWTIVGPYLSPPVRENAQAYFEKAFAEINFHQVSHVITHSDLATNNILYDYQNRSLAGVIDFSDICLADPAVDFAGFYRHFGYDFINAILTYYSSDVGDQFMERIEFHANRKLIFVIYYALKHGFTESIPDIVKSIEKGLLKGA